MKKIFNKIKTYTNNAVLCIRFPFLYPRNRFNDYHYNNWSLNQTILDCEKNSKITYNIIIKHIKDKDDIQNIDLSAKYRKYLSIYNKENNFNIIEIHSHNQCKEYDLSNWVNCANSNKNFIKDIVCDLDESNKHIRIYVFVDDDCDISHHFILDEFIINKYFKYIAKFLKWIYKYPLQLLHCFPTYTELDSMPYGWREAFGIKLCKELRSQLIKDHYLYKYRITQIKEKYGELRWYDSGSSAEVFNIINKYSMLSYTTCINCGKPAIGCTKGWIEPYCEDCMPTNDFDKFKF